MMLCSAQCSTFRKRQYGVQANTRGDNFISTALHIVLELQATLAGSWLHIVIVIVRIYFHFNPEGLCEINIFLRRYQESKVGPLA